MADIRDNLEILLVQFRDEQTQHHEERCFLKYTKLSGNELAPYDAINLPFAPEVCAGYDAVVLGGSYEHRVSAGEPHTLPVVCKVIQHCVEIGIPLYGSCFGSHLITYALGGKVEYAPDRAEVKTIDVHLYPEATDDPLFHGMPETFRANAGRTDDIIALPGGAVPLAFSDQVKYHAYRLADKPVYAVQFHAELGQKEQRERMAFAHQFGGYFGSDEEFQQQYDLIEETPEAGSLLERFIDIIVVPYAARQVSLGK